MIDQPPPSLPHAKDEPQPTVAGGTLWQSVRRPRRGRLPAPPVAAQGPYETSYPIAVGYPDREIVIR